MLIDECQIYKLIIYIFNASMMAFDMLQYVR